MPEDRPTPDRHSTTEAWPAEHQAEFGTFDEAELRASAADAGVAYLLPLRS